MRQRVYRKRLYLVAIPQGISGFRQAAVPGIVTGAKVKRDLLDPWTGDRVIVSQATFRMNDGHLPEYQPTGNIEEVTTYLEANPFGEAIVTDRGTGG